MYRTAANRLLAHSFRSLTTTIKPTYIHPSSSFLTSSRFSTSSFSSSNPNPNSNPPHFNSTQSQTPNFSDHSTQTTSSSSSSEEPRSRRPVVEYEEEQARVLQASLRHVESLGWTETAMLAGAREVGLSPSIVGSFPRKEAALVEYFMDECLERLIDIIESDTELKNLIPSQHISKLVRIRLEMQASFISKWAQALSIQALPTNVPTSFKQRAALIDEIWHAAGDDASDFDWYVKRTVLGGIYSTTEVYMLTDKTPDFRDTWAFLDARVRDAFDLKKTLQEAQYLAEAVGAGLGGSFQGLVKGVFKR
ncbi:ubiquinone biosynthesis protein COQ9, mitochondrial-like [Chenopodium quinoa]|uniref:Ubiquinone biosynthesis protein n=1 Tax=Chenopodium quinoa TaxID=63459 RepID=A0A803MF84_CHEQI|nr:ubiquinone biosynthesis protein COQ9, mitochondrial-like [Chenopodium quinoa]